MKGDKLKSYLKEQMGEYTHPVDEELWSSIVKDVPVKKRVVIPFWRVAAMSAAAVLLLALVLFGPGEADNGQNMQILSENRFNILPDSLIIEQPGSLIAQSVQKIDVDNLAMIEESRKTVGINNKNEEKEETESVEQKEQQSEQENNKNSVYDEKRKQELDNQAIKFDDNGFETGLDKRGRTSGNVNNGISMQITTVRSAGFSFLSANYDDYNDLGDPSDSTGGKDSIPENNSTNLSTIMVREGNIDNNSDIYKRIKGAGSPKYLSPLNFALTVRKEFDEIFSLESGLSYTYLRKEFKEADLKLHYIGIPVKVLINIHRNARRTLSFYGGVQGMMEFNFAGRFKDKYGSCNVTTSKPQYSYGFSVGFEVMINRPVWFFIEPGYMHFSDDGSEIPTIRKDEPNNLSLQLGLRFNIN